MEDYKFERLQGDEYTQKDVNIAINYINSWKSEMIRPYIHKNDREIDIEARTDDRVIELLRRNNPGFNETGNKDDIKQLLDFVSWHNELYKNEKILHGENWTPSRDEIVKNGIQKQLEFFLKQYHTMEREK